MLPDDRDPGCSGPRWEVGGGLRLVIRAEIRADTAEENGAILQPRLDSTQWCVSETGKQMNKSGEIKSVPWSWLKQQ